MVGKEGGDIDTGWIAGDGAIALAIVNAFDGEGWLTGEIGILPFSDLSRADGFVPAVLSQGLV